MRKCEFNVGDVVVIKDYEEMVEEFGIFDNSSYTDTPVFIFSPDNKKFCGKIIIIESLDYRSSVFRDEECFVINKTDDDIESDFVITTDMVKLYKTKDINSASQKDIDDFLG